MSGRLHASTRPTSTRRDELLDALIELFFAEGFLHFSTADLTRRLGCSKTTLYQVAPSKEQIVVAVVKAIFRRSTEQVEARVSAVEDPVERIRTYLMSISDELSPASAAYFADLDAFAPAREIYRHNTQAAAQRVQDLVHAAAPANRVSAAFTGAVAGLVMEAIHRGEIEAATSLDDSGAFRELALLVTSGIDGRDG